MASTKTPESGRRTKAKGHFLSRAQRRTLVGYSRRQNRNCSDSRCPSAVRLQQPTELFLAADVGERDGVGTVGLLAARLVPDWRNFFQSLVEPKAVIEPLAEMIQVLRAESHEINEQFMPVGSESAVRHRSVSSCAKVTTQQFGVGLADNLVVTPMKPATHDPCPGNVTVAITPIEPCDCERMPGDTAVDLAVESGVFLWIDSSRRPERIEPRL